MSEYSPVRFIGGPLDGKVFPVQKTLLEYHTYTAGIAALDGTSMTAFDERLIRYRIFRYSIADELVRIGVIASTSREAAYIFCRWLCGEAIEG